MNFRIIARKIKEPSLPYVSIARENFNIEITKLLNERKKCIYVHAYNGFGKTVAVNHFLQNKQKDLRCWYMCDEWDKDQITFINYLYNVFKFRNLISNELEGLLSQPLDNDKKIQNFIGLLSNELDLKLNKETYLVFDNFNEIQKDSKIMEIMGYLIDYCPDLLKIIILSNEKIPKDLYKYYLKQEIAEINQKKLLINEKEAYKILEKIEKKYIPIEEILNQSQKCISLFLLLANKYETDLKTNSINEKIILENAIEETIKYIYKDLPFNIKQFIFQTILVSEININKLKRLFNNNYKESLNFLLENEIIIQNNNIFSYNSSFLEFLENEFYNLDQDEKETYLDKIIELFTEDDKELLLAIFIKAKSYFKVLEYFKNNYEYYFRNYLYETIQRVIFEIKDLYNDNHFFKYLKVRLLRSTGKINEATSILKKIESKSKSNLLTLEAGICEAYTGHFKQSIEILEELEKSADLSIHDYITLVNCIGISKMQLHKLDSALDYFAKASKIDNKSAYQQDLMKIYHNIGLTYTWMGNFSESTNAYDQAIYLSEKYNLIPPSMTKLNLAIIHNLQGEYQKAYENCISGLEIAHKVNSNIDKFNINLYLAEAYRGLNKKIKVEECLTFLNSFDKTLLNPIQDALYLKLKAHLEIDKKEYESAKNYINKAISIRKLRDGDKDILEYKLELAEINFYDQQYHEVINIFSEIEEILFTEKHQYHLARLYVYKALSNEKLGDSVNQNKYTKLATKIISKNNYKLLENKLNPQKNIYKDIKIKAKNDIREELEEPLLINTFGQLEVSKGSKVITKKEWQGKKTRLFFSYLLINKQGISKETLFENLFPESENPSSVLHVNINRVRKAMKILLNEIVAIQFNNQLYSFNFSLDYQWDAHNMEYLINSAKQEKLKSKKAKLLSEALKLYKGHFMQGFELESWVFSTQEYYRRMAYDSFKFLCEYYLEINDPKEILEISDQFLKIDNCFEEACKYKMKTLINLGKKHEASKQYKVFKNSVKKMLNDEPSIEIKQIAETLK